MYKPLEMAYLRCFQGFLYFLMVGKVMDLGCVLREEGKRARLLEPATKIHNLGMKIHNGDADVFLDILGG